MKIYYTIQLNKSVFFNIQSQQSLPVIYRIMGCSTVRDFTSQILTSVKCAIENRENFIHIKIWEEFTHRVHCVLHTEYLLKRKHTIIPPPKKKKDCYCDEKNLK